MELTIKHYLNLSLTDLDNEYWEVFPENKQYFVSSLGRIKSIQQSVNGKYNNTSIKKARILKQYKNDKGYLGVGLTIDGKTKSFRVSRLVAMTFIPNPENKPQVNHINGIKDDNRVINLEWNTSGENVKHAWNNGLSKKQSSYLYIKDRLSKINPYLDKDILVSTPIGIGKVIIDQNCYRIEYKNGKIENLIKSIRFWQHDFKLILLNLSDLTKEITHNGETFVPIENIAIYSTTNQGLAYLIEQIRTGFIEVIVFNKLLEWHFDVFGLIENNLAIDLNTLK
jgi:hypothetical protein